MSDIPRYRPVANDKYGITDDVDGKLCEYRDYARLKAEVERLRIAGEDLAHAVRTKHGVDFALEEWDKEANKGGQP